MGNNYEVLYGKIVKGEIPKRYSGPEEQGKEIQRCSILKSVEIEYSSNNRIRNEEHH